MRLLLPIGLLLTFFNINSHGASIDQRQSEEQQVQELSFSMIPHKPNYLLPFSYNQKIQSYSVYQDTFEDGDQQPLEMKFQVSFKIPLFAIDQVPVIDAPLAVYFGYTQVSFWQAYNTDNSSPFRESNYEPEIFAVWRADMPVIGDWRFKIATLNFTHQSNGQTDDLSRSWNRFESNLIFENNNLIVSLNPWVRLEEDASEDDNRDLLDYYGHGKIAAIYTHGNNTFTFTSRNNLESNFSKGSVNLDWSFPLGSRVRGYLQLFSGYGNSMIEYDQYTNTIGLGISLTDWL